MTDDELIACFETGDVPPGGFHHREHVRVAWCYLCREPLGHALERFRAALRRFAEKQGAPALYHETITTAYVLLIAERVQASGRDGSWESFAAANPDLFASNYFLGFAYRAKQNWEKCGSNFDTFLKKVGSDRKAAEQIGHSNREGGLCYARAESTAKAIPMLEKAAAAKPDDKEVQFLLGVALMRENRENEAERAFTKVIQLDPSLPNDLMGLVSLAGHKHDVPSRRPGDREFHGTRAVEFDHRRIDAEESP